METKTQQNMRLFLKLFTPSRTGGLLTIVFACAVVLAIMTPRFYDVADMSVYLQYIQENPTGLYKQSLEASNIVNSSKFAADTSVFIVWGVAGLIGYSLVTATIRLVKNTRDFIDDLEYSEQRKKDIEREALVHALLRVIAACSIFLLYLLFINVMLPLVVVFAQIALMSELLEATFYTLAAVAVTALCLHLMVVALRLALLRTRVFFNG